MSLLWKLGLGDRGWKQEAEAKEIDKRRISKQDSSFREYSRFFLSGSHEWGTLGLAWGGTWDSKWKQVRMERVQGKQQSWEAVEATAFTVIGCRVTPHIQDMALQCKQRHLYFPEGREVGVEPMPIVLDFNVSQCNGLEDQLLWGRSRQGNKACREGKKVLRNSSREGAEHCQCEGLAG